MLIISWFKKNSIRKEYTDKKNKLLEIQHSARNLNKSCKKLTGKRKMNKIAEKDKRWWICLWPSWGWLLHGCVSIAKIIKLYTLNIYNPYMSIIPQ